MVSVPASPCSATVNVPLVTAPWPSEVPPGSPDSWTVASSESAAGILPMVGTRVSPVAVIVSVAVDVSPSASVIVYPKPSVAV